MPQPPDPARVDAARTRVTSRVIGEALRPGTAPIRRGVVLTPPPDGLTPTDALLTRVLAVERTSERRRVYAQHSAAAVLGLPIIGPWPTLVEYLSVPDDKGRSPGVRRRRTDRPVQPVCFAGLWITPVARTVIDLARELPLAHALPAADHALHQEWCTPGDLRREAAALPRGYRGRRRASLVAELADGLNESVGESLSRARMFELRVPRPVLQVVRTPDGDRVDYFWPGLGLSGEFDGRLKYGLLPGQTGEDAAAAVFEEKRREDRIRGVGDRVGRWVWDDAYDIGRFEWVMRGLGLIPGSGIADWPSLSGPGKR